MMVHRPGAPLPPPQLHDGAQVFGDGAGGGLRGGHLASRQQLLPGQDCEALRLQGLREGRGEQEEEGEGEREVLVRRPRTLRRSGIKIIGAEIL